MTERDPRHLPGGELDYGRHPRPPHVASLYAYNATGIMGTWEWNQASGMRFLFTDAEAEAIMKRIGRFTQY